MCKYGDRGDPRFYSGGRGGFSLSPESLGTLWFLQLCIILFQIEIILFQIEKLEEMIP